MENAQTEPQMCRFKDRIQQTDLRLNSHNYKQPVAALQRETCSSCSVNVNTHGSCCQSTACHFQSLVVLLNRSYRTSFPVKLSLYYFLLQFLKQGSCDRGYLLLSKMFCIKYQRHLLSLLILMDKSKIPNTFFRWILFKFPNFQSEPLISIWNKNPCQPADHTAHHHLSNPNPAPGGSNPKHAQHFSFYCGEAAEKLPSLRSSVSSFVWKLRSIQCLCLMSWTSRYDSALNRHDLYTRGHDDWSSFQTKICLMINILYLPASINDSLTTRQSPWTRSGHSWYQGGYWWTVYEELMGDELVLWCSIRSVCQRVCS